MQSISELRVGETAKISEFDINLIPLKLIEMGCLPGSLVTLIQMAPFKGPLFLVLNGSNVAIRKDLAQKIFVTKV